MLPFRSILCSLFIYFWVFSHSCPVPFDWRRRRNLVEISQVLTPEKVLIWGGNPALGPDKCQLRFQSQKKIASFSTSVRFKYSCFGAGLLQRLCCQLQALPQWRRVFLPCPSLALESVGLIAWSTIVGWWTAHSAVKIVEQPRRQSVDQIWIQTFLCSKNLCLCMSAMTNYRIFSCVELMFFFILHCADSLMTL